MFHLSPPPIGFIKRHQLTVRLLTLLLICGVLTSFRGLSSAHAASFQAPRQQTAVSIPPPPSVIYADSHWNWATFPANNHSTVSAGSPQPQYQCAEFVARSLVYESPFPHLTTSSSQYAYEYYQPGDG